MIEKIRIHITHNNEIEFRAHLSNGRSHCSPSLTCEEAAVFGNELRSKINEAISMRNVSTSCEHLEYGIFNKPLCSRFYEDCNVNNCIAFKNRGSQRADDCFSYAERLKYEAGKAAGGDCK